MNALLGAQVFPARWKLGKLILLPKGDHRLGKYRPICLLTGLCKVYESLVRMRVERVIEESGGLSPHQYGFRKGRSTVDAVLGVFRALEGARDSRWAVLVLFDVRNAFNTLEWSVAMKALEGRGSPDYLLNVVGDYFRERKLYVEEGAIVEVTAGVPQGSVLGPTLWNLAYDGVMSQEYPEGATPFGFVDDLAVLVVAADLEELRYRTQQVCHRVQDWMDDHGLLLAAEKTEAIILKGPRKRDGVYFEYDRVRITPSKYVKYLGVTLQENGSFGEHLRRVTRRAAERAAALGRIMPNIGGPTSERRKVLFGVVQSIILYAAPVWYRTVDIPFYRNIIARADRTGLIRTACAYRTAPTAALYVITGMVPTPLLAKERRRLYERENVDERVRSDERAATIQLWQHEWEGTVDTSQWTKSLIPDLCRWIGCGHRRIDYFLTQVLTGHGCFRSYLHRFGRSDSDSCPYCGEVDTVTHTLLRCPRWATMRMQMNVRMGDVESVKDLVECMLESKCGWDTGWTYVRSVLAEKEREERE